MEDEVIEIDRDNLKENMKMSFEGSLRDSKNKVQGNMDYCYIKYLQAMNCMSKYLMKLKMK